MSFDFTFINRGLHHLICSIIGVKLGYCGNTKIRELVVVLSENCVTKVLQRETKKGLHFCNPLLSPLLLLGVKNL